VEAILVGAAALIAFVAAVAFVISRGGDERPIAGMGDMTRAQAEARARSAGIDHMAGPNP